MLLNEISQNFNECLVYVMLARVSHYCGILRLSQLLPHTREQTRLWIIHHRIRVDVETIWKVTQNNIEKSKSPTYSTLSRTLFLGIRRPSHPSKLSNHGTNTKQRQWLYKQALLPLNLYFRIHWILPPKKPVSQWTKLQDLHCKNTRTVINLFFTLFSFLGFVDYRIRADLAIIGQIRGQ